MANTISVYDQTAQPRMLLIEQRQKFLLQERYFQTREPEDLFDSKTVTLDFDNGDYGSGAFVKMGYKDGNTTTYFATNVAPPRVGISDTIDTADKDRILFEALCRNDLSPSHADAQDALLRIKAARLVNRASRSIERLCVMALQNNAIQFTCDTSPTDPTQVTIDVEFFNGTNEQILLPGTGVDGTGTATKNWDGTGSALGSASPYQDVCDALDRLVQHGGRAEDLLMSPKMWGYLRADMFTNQNVKDQIHYTVIANGVVEGLFSEEVDGAKCVGQAQFNGHVLNLLTYNGAYKDENGVMTPFLPDNFACILAKDCGKTLCAACSLPNPLAFLGGGAADIKQLAGKYLVYKYYDFKEEQVAVRCASNPLPCPLSQWRWVSIGQNT